MQDHINSDLRFSIIPEWVIDADISDRAIRLYSILARYADNETLQAFPSRETLAKRAHCHIKSVDRGIQELIDIGAVLKAHRRNGESYQSNIYTLKRVGTAVSPGRDTPDQGVGTGESPGRDTSVHLTRTTELEPDNYIDAKKNATSIPDNYTPSASIQETFESKYGSVLSYEETVEAFTDFHLAKGSRFKDWDAAFRTWCRNAITFKGPKTVIHKQELKPNAEIPDARAWVKQMHELGEHFECRAGEFGCK
jgi:hypothetical protein